MNILDIFTTIPFEFLIKLNSVEHVILQNPRINKLSMLQIEISIFINKMLFPIRHIFISNG